MSYKHLLLFRIPICNICDSRIENDFLTRYNPLKLGKLKINEK